MNDEEMNPPDDGSEVSEIAKDAEVAGLLEKLAANPYDYESHVAYVTLLRGLGNAGDLHEARKFFYSYFPLSEGMLPYLPTILA